MSERAGESEGVPRKTRTHKNCNEASSPIADEIVPDNPVLFKLLRRLLSRGLELQVLKAYSRVTLPPIQVNCDELVHIDDEWNRGHSVVLHPAKKKKLSSRWAALLRRQRTEAIVDIHKSSVLGEFQRLFLSQHPLRMSNERRKKQRQQHTHRFESSAASVTEASLTWVPMHVTCFLLLR